MRRLSLYEQDPAVRWWRAAALAGWALAIPALGFIACLFAAAAAGGG